MVLEKEAPPEGIRHPGRQCAGNQQPTGDVHPYGAPVHDEVVADRGEAPGRAQSPPDRTALADAHVHLGVPLHPPEHAAVRLSPGLLDQLRSQEAPKQHHHQPDHDRPADELACGELPPDEEGQDDPQLDHKVGGGELERHRGGEVCALAKQRTGEGDGCVGTRRRGRTEPSGDRQGAR